VVHHIILLQGISAGTFNEDPSMIKSFRQAIATLLKVLESDILNIVASEKDDTRRRLQQSRRRLESPSCSVSYDIRTESEEEMETVSTQMTTTFADSDTFTTELQSSMVANNIDSVSPEAISSDTTASPEKKGTDENNPQVVGSEEKDASSEAESRDDDDVDVFGGLLWKLGLGLAGIVLVGAVIALVVRNKRLTRQLQAYSPTDEPAVPTIEMFETRGSTNFGNPMNEKEHADLKLTVVNDQGTNNTSQQADDTTSWVRHLDEASERWYVHNMITDETKWENEEAVAIVQVKAAQPSRLMPEPQHHSRTSTELPSGWAKHTTGAGRKYYGNTTTQESTWAPPPGSTGGSSSK